MSLRCLAVALLILVPVMGVHPISQAAPSVVIITPEDNTQLTTRTVNVTGTAKGAEATWIQSSGDDFSSGSFEDAYVDFYDDVRMNITRYDDFNYTGGPDNTKWNEHYKGGLKSDANGEVLVLGGTVDAQEEWGARACVTSNMFFPGIISAELVNFSGTGSGRYSQVGLCEDDGDSVWIGLRCDPWSNNTTVLWWGYNISGACSEFGLGPAGAFYNHFMVTCRNSTARVYHNGVEKASTGMSLGDMRGILDSRARAFGDTLSAEWDDVIAGDRSVYFGTYTSAPFDTGASDPVLRKVLWGDVLSTGTSVTLQARSADNPSMDSPMDWTTVQKGQTVGLPAVKRYLQYRAILASNDGLWTPWFQDLTLRYLVPVEKVELSIDDQTTWLPANGTETWSAVLTLPENSTRVWVRATDAAGYTATTSITLKVDVSPPEGNIIINGGARYTADRLVNVTMNVTDISGIEHYRIGDRSDLSDLQWVPFEETVAFYLPPGDGPKSIFAQFRDLCGLESGPMAGSITVHTGRPRGSVIINGGAEYASSTEVALTFNTEDLAGVDQVMVSDSVDFNGRRWTPPEQNLSWNLSAVDGEQRVFARFRNVVGTVSETVNDSIVLDTKSPTLRLTLNRGEPCTNNRTIALWLDASDDNPVEKYQSSEDRSFSGAIWEAYVETTAFDLSAGEGRKTVHVRVRDGAENPSAVISADVTLDTTPPVSTLSKLPAVSERLDLDVRWSAVDPLSGIRHFDVQYREGDGKWEKWLGETTAGNATFSGKDGVSYRFRVRATDRAGNQEPFPEAAADPVLFLVPVPRVAIDSPLLDTVVTGMFVAYGTAAHPKAGQAIHYVEIRLDNGTWAKATGTHNWTYGLDASRLGKGRHVLTVRAFDGTRYSAEQSTEFVVKDVPREGGDGNAVPIVLAAMVIAGGVGAAAFALWRRRKKPGARA